MHHVIRNTQCTGVLCNTLYVIHNAPCTCNTLYVIHNVLCNTLYMYVIHNVHCTM